MCLYKRNFLLKVNELKYELSVFFLNQLINQNFIEWVSDCTVGNILAYLVDIFELQNALNSSLQGKGSKMLFVTDKFCAFRQKMKLWLH